MKLKSAISVLVVLAAIVGLGVTWASKFYADENDATCTDPNGRTVQCSAALVFPYGGPFEAMKAAISAAEKAGTFKRTDFEKLDFSKPGDTAFGKNPKYEMFNSAGPFHVLLYKGEIYPNLLSNVGNKDSQIVYSIYRWPGFDRLYAVITNVRPWMCRADQLNHQVEHVDLSPNSAGPVLQSATSDVIITSGCLKDSKGIWYWFDNIDVR